MLQGKKEVDVVGGKKGEHSIVCDEEEMRLQKHFSSSRKKASFCAFATTQIKWHRE